MRLWLVCNAPVRGEAGAPGRKRRLGEELARRGHGVTIFGHEVMGRRWGRLAKHLFAFEVSRKLKRAAEPPELIDASGAEAWALLRRPRARRPAVVVRSHGIEHRFYQAYRRELRKGYPRELVVPRLGLAHRLLRLRLVERCVRRSDHLICISSQERDYVLERGWKEPERISVINNGVDEAFFAERAYSGENQRVLFVGSWIFMKGVRYFAAAMNRLLAERPGMELSLVGTGLVPAGIILAAFGEGVRGRVRLVPRLPHSELVNEYLGHEVFVTPTLMESFGNVLAEAMAAGCACAATPFGAAADLGRDGENIVIVPPADPDALAGKVAWLLDHPAERERLGRAARGQAERLRWATIASRHESLYEQVAGARGKGGTS